MLNSARLNHVRQVNAMHRAMDQLFEETGYARQAASQTKAPTTRKLALDIHEDENGYTLSAALPGVKAEDIHVKFHENYLHIEVEIPRVAQENSKSILLERPYGKFSRQIQLPEHINADAVEARYEQGVLTLVLPKAEEARPRTIAVNAKQNS